MAPQVTRKRAAFLAAMSILIVALFTGQTPAPTQIAAAAAGDWPMYMNDIARSGANLSETAITPASMSHLAPAWKFTTGGNIVAMPTITNGVLYIGSWDGYEYAVDVATHQQLWRQNLGTTTQGKSCYAPTVGVSSTAAVQNGVVYVGGGDGNLYALSSSDGSVLWKTLLGTPPYYNWSSPVVYNNRVYVGMAAFCDPPYVQGKVVALNVSDGSIAASLSLVPDGSTGAPVWSSVAVDVETGRLFVTTGNNGSQVISQQPNAEAVLALDPNTLAVLDRWQIPPADQVPDSDFGATPLVFDANGAQYIGVLNKNGIYYVLNRTNLAAGPVWKQIMSGNSQVVPGDNVSNACYVNGVIYAGSAGGTINGVTYGGSVRAFNATTGNTIWGVNTTGSMTAPVTCTSQLVVDAQGNTVEIRSAATGQLLFSYVARNKVAGGSVISNGMLYTPSRDGSVYTFNLQNMAIPGLIFQDNFDAYTPGALPTGAGTVQWSAVTVKGTGFALAVSGAQSNSSPNALQVTLSSTIGGSAWALKSYGGTGFTSHATRFSLYLDPSLSTGTQAIALIEAENRSNTKNGSCTLLLTPANRLQVLCYDSAGGKHVVTPANVLSLGQWYTVELDQVNAPSSGSWSLWLNGTQIAGQTNVNTGSLPVNAIVAGEKNTTAVPMAGFFYEDNIITASQHIG